MIVCIKTIVEFRLRQLIDVRHQDEIKQAQLRWLTHAKNRFDEKLF